jgi:hypothetical protein
VAKSLKAPRIAVASFLLIGGAVAALATIAFAGSSNAASTLSLKGSWVGHRERMAATEGYKTGLAKLTVTQQKGLTFKGTLTRYNPDGNVTEPLAGAFTPGGALGMGSDVEGTYSFKFIDSSTLDYCYTESGKEYRTTCARLRKR